MAPEGRWENTPCRQTSLASGSEIQNFYLWGNQKLALNWDKCSKGKIQGL